MIRLSQIPTAAQAEAIIAAGPGALVQHPRAGNRKGRGRLARQLGALGVPSEIVATIGWSTTSGDADRIPVAEVTSEQWLSVGFVLDPAESA